VIALLVGALPAVPCVAGEFDGPPALFGARSAKPAGAYPVSSALSSTRDSNRALVREEALRAGLPPDVADAVAEVESAYNPAASGAAGEVGLMQVMPATARMLGFAGSNAELATPEVNVRYGVMYLAQAWRLAGQDICTATMKYRAGHGETRFSHLSMDYCIRVRAKLAARGFPITGVVPQATFGSAAVAGRGGGRRILAGRGIDLSHLNRKLYAIAASASGSAVKIALR
jgi:soluble lytic murein transglycosylase-like protein